MLFKNYLNLFINDNYVSDLLCSTICIKIYITFSRPLKFATKPKIAWEGNKKKFPSI